MAEKLPIIQNVTMSYSGLFDVKELYSAINEWFKDKGYDRREIKNEEHVSPSGKFIDIEIMPYKKLSDYAKSVIRIQITMHDVKEVEIERDKHKVKLNQGSIEIIFDSYLETDYEGRWEQTPFYFFMRTVYDKFFYKNYTEHFEEMVASDTREMEAMIKSFLNMYRFRK
ncbi:hypothetical protein COV21_02525 [Candidatus Woesearchaeota archaeon CG10_big_fil_rev_8_21_14_0_10_45_5]|jgi:hypothetical protein|nr:MAG: hypothetical protein COV21_02525 [Candidatus Woesearchaeota archaeon CG10_big_fil_rev_8_21_14_0_10_45_5]PIU30101.1 MAG: hypothetical protein COT07_02540 [Candidatus Woesearchaeota archaeon CG07_land_8_20_14_0_80_44_23]